MSQASQVAPGGQLAVTNAGSQVHNLVIDGGGQTADLAAGDSETIPVDLGEGDYTVYCSIAGHREAGMESTLQVAEGAVAAEPWQARQSGSLTRMACAKCSTCSPGPPVTRCRVPLSSLRRACTTSAASPVASRADLPDCRRGWHSGNR